MSSIDSISSYISTVATDSYKKTASKTTDTTSETASSSIFDEEAAVYEKSDSTDSVTTKSTTASSTDRSAIVEQLKADSEAMTNRLLTIVQQSITGQGNAYGIANFTSMDDDFWQFIASGDYTVDEAAKAQAQADIAEGGYWSVEETASRIVDFAKALSGNDTSKAETLLEAFKEGYSQATASWGKDLPDISANTYDAVLKKFDEWVNGTEETEETEA